MNDLLRIRLRLPLFAAFVAAVPSALLAAQLAPADTATTERPADSEVIYLLDQIVVSASGYEQAVVNIITRREEPEWRGDITLDGTFQADRDFGGARTFEAYAGGPLVGERLSLRLDGWINRNSAGLAGCTPSSLVMMPIVWRVSTCSPTIPTAALTIRKGVSPKGVEIGVGGNSRGP